MRQLKKLVNKEKRVETVSAGFKYSEIFLTPLYGISIQYVHDKQKTNMLLGERDYSVRASSKLEGL